MVEPQRRTGKHSAYGSPYEQRVREVQAQPESEGDITTISSIEPTAGLGAQTASTCGTSIQLHRTITTTTGTLLPTALAEALNSRALNSLSHSYNKSASASFMPAIGSHVPSSDVSFPWRKDNMLC
jgi:hypothetical protein